MTRLEAIQTIAQIWGRSERTDGPGGLTDCLKALGVTDNELDQAEV